MRQHYRQLFAGAHERPSMFGLDGSYATAVAFIIGCDAGNDWCLLSGFEEWLLPQTGGARNVAWTGLVLDAAFPDGEPKKPWSAAEDQRAVDTLYRLLDEFFALREAHSGPLAARAIFSTYFEWERNRHGSGG